MHSACFQYDGDISFDLGTIARTQQVARSREIDPNDPMYTIKGGNCGDADGLVQKIGMVTGWTSGRISKSCVAANEKKHNSKQLLPYQYLTESLDGTVISAEGDSGAPVFIANSDGKVALVGVLVDGQGEEREATNFAYSCIGSMKEDFHMITDEQLITYKHPDGVPMITKVDFPSSIPGDGALHPGTVTFTDGDAGINWALLLQLSCEGCSFPPFGFDPGVAALKMVSSHLICGAKAISIELWN